MRLVQGAHQLVVEFCLEWVTNPAAVKQIQVNVNDTLESLGWMPFKLVKNILLTKTDMPRLHVQAAYLRSRCTAWALNYGIVTTIRGLSIFREAGCRKAWLPCLRSHI